MEQNRELRELYETDEEIRNILNISMALEGMPRQASTHACGIVITKEPVDTYVPLYVRDRKYFYTIYNDNSRRTRSFEDGFLRAKNPYSYFRCNEDG